MHTPPCSFRPKLLWDLLLTQHGSYRIHYRSILPLCHSVLLWRKCSRQLSGDTMSFTKLSEFIRREFPSAVCPQASDEGSNIFFNTCFESLEGDECLRFFMEKINPSFSSKIINESQNVPLSAVRNWCDRTTYIRVHQLQLSRCTP